MQILAFRNIYKRPPLPIKKGKRQESETTVQSPQYQKKLEQKMRQFNQLPYINCIKYNSVQKKSSINSSTNTTRSSMSRDKLSVDKNLKTHLKIYKSISVKKVTSNFEQKVLNIQQNTSLPNISAKSWIAYEINQKRIIHGKRINKKRQMASLTKIMNLITAIETIDRFKLNSNKIIVKVTKQSSNIIGTTANLKANMEISLYDLLFGMMLPSGNDAAFLIAYVLGSILKEKQAVKNQIIYNVTSFANFCSQKTKPILTYLQEMNRIAKMLKMNDSTFTNPHGLSQTTNKSTAHDLAKLCQYSIKNKLFNQIINSKQYSAICMFPRQNQIQTQQNQLVQQKQHLTLSWTNTNKMLWQGWNGVKTGVTPNAGPCLAASVQKIINGQKHHILIILLSSLSMDIRWKQMRQISNWIVTQNLIN